jgi:ankyrin repeat protein
MATKCDKTNTGDNSLLFAAYAGSMEFVVPFVNAYGSACYANDEGDTLAHAAADDWQHGMIEYLLVSGANPNAQNARGETPLHMLTNSRTIPSNGAFIRILDISTARNATFQALLLRGADTRIANCQGATPLHVAAWNDDVLAIEHLAPRAGLETRTMQGATALMLAVLNGHSNSAKRLIQFGANADARLSTGNRIIDAIRASDDPAMRALSTQ